MQRDWWAFADEGHHYFLGLCKTPQGVRLVVALRNGAGDPDEGRIIASAPSSVASREALRLRISARGAEYDFSYATGGGPWVSLLSNADGRVLASERTNQFTGTLMGVYAVRSAAP